MSPDATRRVVVLSAALLVGASASMLACAAESAPAKVDGGAVRSHWLRLDEAWNERDAAAFSRLFSEDASLEFVDRGQFFEGRPAIREHFEARFPEIAPGIRHQTHVERVSGLAHGALAADGRVLILRGTGRGRTVAQVVRRFAIFAAMTEGNAGLEIRALRIFEQPPEEPRAGRVLEIRSYNLKPGTVDAFEALFHEEARPLLDRSEIDVVAYGRSLHDANSWILLRSFDDLQQRARLEDAFYGSDAWREGPRDAILERIDSYTTVVLPFDAETVERIRRSLRKD